MRNRRNSPTERDEQRTRETITQTLQAYIHDHPATTVLCMLLPVTQETSSIRHAVAHASLATGKRIDLISLVELNGEEEEHAN
jgi:hypothetical protein